MAEASHRSRGGETGDTRFFHTLDLMRGLAAIAVVSLHLNSYLAAQVGRAAYLAVDLFFILSGVVIDNAYRRRLESGLSSTGFMIIRLIRLWPLYLLGLAIATMVSAGGLVRPDSQWSAGLLALAVVLGALFLPMLGASPSGYVFPLNAPAWSLSFELIINYAYALVVRFLNAAVLAALTLVGAGLLVWVAVAHGNLDVGAEAKDWVFAVPRVIFGFTAGILIARVRSGPPRTAHGAEVLALAVVLMVAFIGPPTQVPGLRAVWDLVCVLVVFPLVVYRGTVADCPASLRGAATFLGVTSYAIYALHIPLAAAFVRQTDRVTNGLLTRGAPWTGIAIIVLLILAAWAADRWYDGPVRRWLTQRRKAAAQAGGPRRIEAS